MTPKIRLISLAGLLLALATGFVAARPGGDDNEHRCPFRYSRDGQTIKLRLHASTKEDKPKEKCCCTPGKPCENCACKEKPGTDNNSAAQGCAPAGMPAVCSPAQSPYDMTFAPPPQYAWMPYPVAQAYAPAPYAVGMVPPPPQMYPAACMPQSREYVVEMKLVEQHKGDKEKVVAMPKVAVCEGQSAECSSGTSHASLWSASMPANEFGHEGYQIGVIVQGDRADHVRLTCSVWTSVFDTQEKLRESRCESTRLAELGKSVKFSCDRVWNGEVVRCWLEATVKEQKETVSAEATPGCCEPCEDAAESCPTACGTCPTACKAAEKMTFSTVDPRHCCQTMCGADGKDGDLNPPCKLLRVSCKGTCMTCDKFELEMANHKPVHVSVEGERVMIVGENLKVMADTVSTAEEGVLVLEGNVRVVSRQGKIDMESGKVRIKLAEDDGEIIQTGVLSNPELIQQP